jgi:hypothetical protein
MLPSLSLLPIQPLTSVLDHFPASRDSLQREYSEAVDFRATHAKRKSRIVRVDRWDRFALRGQMDAPLAMYLAAAVAGQLSLLRYSSPVAGTISRRIRSGEGTGDASLSIEDRLSASLQGPGSLNTSWS